MSARLALVLALAVPLLTACESAHSGRVMDRAGVLRRAERPQFEDYLEKLERESGVDIRFIFVDTVPGSLEEFAVREARALGIGRDQDRRGVLFVYDVSRERLRIEVGPTLQGIFTDRFVGYLMRNHVHSFFAAGDPTLGLRVTLFMLHARLRRARLGEQYDPRAADFIEERRRLATGGGATGTMAAAGAKPLGAQSATADVRSVFVPQSTVEATYARYLEWLLQQQYVADLELFTPRTRNYLTNLPVSPAFRDYIIFLEYGRRFIVLERGDLALLVFTDDPLISPHFFRRTPAGWQMDIFSEVRNTHEYIASTWTWGMILEDDDFTITFIDRYVRFGPMLRLADGDNRALPVKPGDPVATPDVVPLIEQITVADASAQIAQRRGEPVVVLLYQSWTKSFQSLAPSLMDFLRRCERAGFAVLGFSIDDNPAGVIRLSNSLQEHKAPYPPVLLLEWAPGELKRAMEPHGIEIGWTWGAPLIALVGADGRAIAQDEEIVRGGERLAIANVEAALSRIEQGRGSGR